MDPKTLHCSKQKANAAERTPVKKAHFSKHACSAEAL